MKIQILNLSFKNVFERCLDKYHELELKSGQARYALEIRNISLDKLPELMSVFSSKGTMHVARKSAGADILVPGDPLDLIKIIWESEMGDPMVKAAIISRLEYFYDNSSVSGISGVSGAFVPFLSGSQPAIMGILNITPDSFSDGGRYFNIDEAVKHAAELIDAGADIIDIGGESTRPGSEAISEEEELKRVIPVIEIIREKYPDVILSIDSTKSKVIHQSLSLGVKIVNDISGLTFDPEIAGIAAEYDASLVLMHIKGTPKIMQKDPFYDDVVCEIFDFFTKQISLAEKYGVKNIILDPGFGFGKRLNDNYEILQRLNEIKAFGKPVLIGVSRKSFLGKSVSLGIDDRDTATVIAETIAVSGGADIIRTHNVANAVQMKKIVNYSKNPELLKNNV